MLVVVSDFHLTDGSAVRHGVTAKQVRDFWNHLKQTKNKLLSFRRNDEPQIDLVILGDFLDLLRTDLWEKAQSAGIKPWSPPSPQQRLVLEQIIQRIFERNKETIAALKELFSENHITPHYMVGNHDQHLMRYPELFERVHKELGIPYPKAPNPLDFYERSWGDYGVHAHHGDRGDPWNDSRGYLHPIGDAMVTEVYNRFPGRVARAVSGGDVLKQALENLVFVRPYRFAPYWIIQMTRKYGEESMVKTCWNELIEEFLEVDFVRTWIAETQKISKWLNHASAMKTTLQISLSLQFRGWLSITRAFNMISDFFAVTPGSIKRKREQLLAHPDERVRFLVNGHTHNAGMASLGPGKGGRLAYVNTGTWTRVLLPDRLSVLEHGNKPIKNFSPGDYITYATFFTPEENPSHDMEFWTGRINPRSE